MLGLLLCVCWVSLFLPAQIDSYRLRKLKKKNLLQLMPDFTTTERKRQKQGRFPGRRTVFIKQSKSPALCSATEKTLPVAAGFLTDTISWWVFFFIQCRKCSEVQNDLFALVTCDLSNCNGGIHLVCKQWPGAQHRQLKATEKHGQRKGVKQLLKTQGGPCLVFLRQIEDK